jgi:WD40 repeat protein
MTLNTELRIAGKVVLVVGVLTAISSIALGIFFWKEVPIRAIGSHGMVPEDLYSELFAIVLVAIGGAALVPALLGWGMIIRGRIGIVSAVLLTAVLIAVSLLAGGWGLLLGAALVCGALAAYMASLLAAIWAEGRGSIWVHVWDLTALLERRWPIALAVLMVVFGRYALMMILGYHAHPPLIPPHRPELQPPETPVISPTPPSEPSREMPTSPLPSTPRNRPLAGDLANYTRGVMALALSQTGRTLVASGSDSSPRLVAWDMETGRRLWVTDEHGKSDPYQQLEFSPDDRIIAHRIRDDGHLFDAATGHELRRLDACGSEGTRPSVALEFGFAFVPGAAKIIVGGEGICQVDLASGQKELLFSREQNGHFTTTDVRLAPDSGQLWALCGPKIVRWDLATRKKVAQLNLSNNFTAKHIELGAGLASRMVASPDGSRLFTFHLGDQRSIWEWDAHDGTNLGHANLAWTVPTMGPLPAPHRVLIGDYSGALIFDVSTGQSTTPFVSGTHVTGVAVSPDGTFVVTGRAYASKEPTIQVWPIEHRP